MTRNDIREAALAAIHEILDPGSDAKLAKLIKQEDFEFSKVTESSIVIIELCFVMEERLDIEIELADISDNSRLSAFTDRMLQKAASA